MIRKSISFTSPNNEWIKAQVESEEYTNNSDVINDLIRKARHSESQIDFIRQKLIAAEKSGFTDETPEEMLAGFKEKARRNGKL